MMLLLPPRRRMRSLLRRLSTASSGGRARESRWTEVDDPRRAAPRPGRTRAGPCCCQISRGPISDRRCLRQAAVGIRRVRAAAATALSAPAGGRPLHAAPRHHAGLGTAASQGLLGSCSYSCSRRSMPLRHPPREPSNKEMRGAVAAARVAGDRNRGWLDRLLRGASREGLEIGWRQRVVVALGARGAGRHAAHLMHCCRAAMDRMAVGLRDAQAASSVAEPAAVDLEALCILLLQDLIALRSSALQAERHAIGGPRRAGARPRAMPGWIGALAVGVGSCWRSLGERAGVAGGFSCRATQQLRLGGRQVTRSCTPAMPERAGCGAGVDRLPAFSAPRPGLAKPFSRRPRSPGTQPDRQRPPPAPPARPAPLLPCHQSSAATHPSPPPPTRPHCAPPAAPALQGARPSACSARCIARCCGASGSCSSRHPRSPRAARAS